MTTDTEIKTEGETQTETTTTPKESWHKRNPEKIRQYARNRYYREKARIGAQMRAIESLSTLIKLIDQNDFELVANLSEEFDEAVVKGREALKDLS